MSRAYVAGVDPASGARGGDPFAAAVAHPEGNIAILDAVRLWAPPFSPGAVVRECCEWLRSYGLTMVTGDRWSGEVIRELFFQHGIHYEPTDRDRSGFYLDLLPLVNANRVRLLDHPELLRQFRGLERRVGAGRERVDHRRGGHDDASNAAAIALVLAARQGGNWFDVVLRGLGWRGPAAASVPVGTLGFEAERRQAEEQQTLAEFQAAKFARDQKTQREWEENQKREAVRIEEDFQKQRDDDAADARRLMRDGSHWNSWGG